MAEAQLKSKERLHEAIVRGEVEELLNDRGAYYCHICKCRLTSKQTIKKHLDTAKHLHNVHACRVESTNKSEEQMQKATDGGAKPKAMAKLKASTKLQLAIEMGHVKEPENFNGPYHCNICNSDLSSKQSIKKHSDTAKHQRNEEKFKVRAKPGLSESFTAENVDPKSEAGKMLSIPKSLTKIAGEKESTNESDGKSTTVDSDEKSTAEDSDEKSTAEDSDEKSTAEDSDEKSTAEDSDEKSTAEDSDEKSFTENSQEIYEEKNSDEEDEFGGVSKPQGLTPEEQLQQAIRRGDVIEPKNSNGFYQCSLCRCDLSSKQTIKRHLDTAKHKNNEETQGIGGEVESVMDRYENEKVQQASGSANPKKTAEVSGMTTDKLELAIQKGHVTELKNSGGAYRCNVCKNNLSSKRTIKTHIDTIKHQKNMVQPRKSPIAGPSPETDSKAKYCYTDSSEYEASTEEEEEPESNKTDSEDEDDDEEQGTHRARIAYCVQSDPRGHVHIFNYKFKGQGEPLKERRGAEFDSENLRIIFTKMGYKVFCHEDLTSRETKIKLNEIRDDPELYNVDALIVFFLSHGKTPYTFYAENKRELNLRVLQKQFTDKKCKAMAKKPKVFFANYCRGSNDEIPEEIESDAGQPVEVPRDMVIIHASTEGIKAPRFPSKGTHFVLSLCEVLEKYAHEFDLREVYIELDHVVKKMKGRQPKWEDHRFRKFYFNPKS